MNKKGEAWYWRAEIDKVDDSDLVAQKKGKKVAVTKMSGCMALSAPTAGHCCLLFFSFFFAAKKRFSADLAVKP